MNKEAKICKTMQQTITQDNFKYWIYDYCAAKGQYVCSQWLSLDKSIVNSNFSVVMRGGFGVWKMDTPKVVHCVYTHNYPAQVMCKDWNVWC